MRKFAARPLATPIHTEILPVERQNLWGILTVGRPLNHDVITLTAALESLFLRITDPIIAEVSNKESFAKLKTEFKNILTTITVVSRWQIREAYAGRIAPYNKHLTTFLRLQNSAACKLRRCLEIDDPLIMTSTTTDRDNAFGEFMQIQREVISILKSD
jgi:hypothetical protein